jgi:hypothetical protein
MPDHPWTTVEVDGGPVGIGIFWECTVCGAAGGPAWEMMGDLVKSHKRPFIPGPARKVSSDCGEAQKQMREYAEEIIAKLRKRWTKPGGEHYHYASLFHDALRWNPQVKNIMPLLRLLQQVDSPLGGNPRPPLMECSEELEKAGFDMSGGALGDAVRELGESRYQDLRSGKDTD